MNYIVDIFFDGDLHWHMGSETLESAVNAVESEIQESGNVVKADIYIASGKGTVSDRVGNPIHTITVKDREPRASVARYSLRSRACNAQRGRA